MKHHNEKAGSYEHRSISIACFSKLLKKFVKDHRSLGGEKVEREANNS